MTQQRQSIRESVLLFGEGPEDRAWLRHLVKGSSDPENRHVITHCGYGGSVVDVVNEAIKRARAAAYDKVVVVVDGDRFKRGEYEQARLLAEKNGYVFIVVKPCMEALLLRILEPKKKWQAKSSAECKRYFEATYVRSRKRTSVEAYAKDFTMDKIAASKKDNPELADILGWITNTPLDTSTSELK